MTKEELLEMVDATINENGTRSITGKALNLALTEIINAMGTGGGAGVELAYVDVTGSGLTPEQLASNIALYTKVEAAANAGQVLPHIAIDASAMLGVPTTVVSTMTAFVKEDSAMASQMGVGVIFMDYFMLQATFALAHDGTVTVNPLS